MTIMDEITLKDLPIELQISIYVYSLNKHRSNGNEIILISIRIA